MKKVCTKCGEEKELSDFPVRSKKDNSYRNDCKNCHSNITKQRYQFNRKIVEDIKTNLGCLKCGFSNPVALDYHHIDPLKKDIAVSGLVSNSSLKAALEEIEKCTVLCANCHRIFHDLEKNQSITITDFLGEDYSQIKDNDVFLQAKERLSKK